MIKFVQITGDLGVFTYSEKKDTRSSHVMKEQAKISKQLNGEGSGNTYKMLF